jgi:hypothetical protein
MLKHTPQRNSAARAYMLTQRRAAQLARVPDVDSRVRFYSKNSEPEYRVGKKNLTNP